MLDRLAQPVGGLDLDREIEKEMKRLTGGGPKEPHLEEAKQADDSGPQMLSPRGSGNDMKFWFGDEPRVSGRGSGNDPRFKNVLASQGREDDGEPQEQPRTQP